MSTARTSWPFAPRYPLPVDSQKPESPRQHGRRLAAIMFTDMVGYSALSHENEARAISLLAIQTRLLEPVLVLHGGRLVKTMGDGAFVEFGSAVSACRAGLEIQAAIVSHNLQASEQEQFHIRIGIHIGDVEVVGDDLLGHGVNVAARIEPLAEADGVCVSEDVKRQVENRVDCSFDTMGPQALKNIGDPVTVYRLMPKVSRSSSKKLNNKKIPSLAVLPLVNLSPDPENEYFGDGLTEEILWALAKIQTLRVVSRTSCFALKGTSHSVGEVGKTLGVDQVLEGSVRRAGNRIRVTVQLVDIKSDRPLWSERYDRDLEDIFAIQEEITASIVDALQIVISEAERGTIGKIPTKNLEAYSEYLKALYKWSNTKDAIQIVAHLRKAVELDPEFARAHAMLSASALAHYRFFDSKDASSLEEAKAAAQRALELEPESCEAFTAVAEIAQQEDRIDDAAEALRRAIEIDPCNYYALYTYGRLQSMYDRRVGAELLLCAADAQPDDYQAAIMGSAKLEEVDGLETARPHIEEAIRRAERFIKYGPKLARPWNMVAFAYLLLGKRDEAIKAADTAFEIEPEMPSTLYNLACFYTKAGELERAIELLQSACEQGFGFAQWLRGDSDLDPIRDDPRVQDLLAKMDARMASDE